ncbi:MAG: alanine racemase [Candidatus Omnitrophica bacterium]|nr:alanine racemase [Candidatus Omnitrophota bacterium]
MRAWIELDIKKIKRNIKKIKDYTNKKLLASVKSDFYGMGVKNIVKEIDDMIDFYGVACLSEAIELKEIGVLKPILIMGSIYPEQVEDSIIKDIRITLCNKEVLNEIIRVCRKYQKKAIVHIKVDTGMGRIGLREKEVFPFIQEVIKNKEIEIEGIFSHLATSEWKDKSYAMHQLNLFKNIIEKIDDKIIIPLKHIANSGAILNLPESYKNFDMVRIGLLLLGVYPEKYLSEKVKFECAISCFTRVNFIKEVEKGVPLSYGLSFTTKKKTKVATIGIGYGDGLRRCLSNNFYLKWKDKKVKIIGNICMDQTLLDVTGKDVKIGDVVKVIGDNFEVEDMANICKTVPQEILCGFGNKRVEKIYLK